MTKNSPPATSGKQQEALVAVEIENANNSNTSSNSSISTTTIPYYGSREPKQSIKETDRVIFQMMDDIQISKTTIQEKAGDVEAYKELDSFTCKKPAAKHHGILWRFRIVLSSIVILLLVVGMF
ncbi:hypothetical protein [Parasitella parasitica]|uniref:Uncharacterized protein n=1 Tax=Parasitella parasitica TaxID=35722 RepID=A0A0B7MRD1_9FUNG|nr:hypothetical protein [Parasitella parasitica]